MHLQYQDDLTNTPDNLCLDSCHNLTTTLKNHNLRMRSRNFSQQQDKQKKKDLFKLKKLVTKHKVKILTRNFISKINRNNPFRKPPEQQFQERFQETSILTQIQKYFQQKPGFVLGNWAISLWSFINIIQVTMMVFIFCIMIAFDQTVNDSLFFKLRISSAVLYGVDMAMNLFIQRFQNGRRIINIKEIAQNYFKNGFLVDFLSIVGFLFDTCMGDHSNTGIILFVLIVALIKLYNNIGRFQKYEHLYIKTSQQEQYYGLLKVLLINFTIGHFLSICLNLMAGIDPQHSWYLKIGIQQQHWFIRYIWGYYWGTNIMLTVGFGDISANNYIEAMILVFIQTFSCITLAYNISNVGALIGQLRASNSQKQKRLKVFHRMSEDNEIPHELNSKITNFIQQSFQIKEFFDFDEEDKLIESLPKGIQSQYRVEANKILFDNIGFFKNLSSKTLVRLAQNVERKISHPDQVYRKKGTFANFSVIFKGDYGLCFKKSNSKLNGTVIQTLSVKKKQKPKIISLDFIKRKFYDFDIRSLSYGIIYFMQEKDFMSCLKQTAMDYELFCIMRDKDQSILNQNQIYRCKLCQNEYHTRFNCSRIHYLPIKQHCINIFLGKKQTSPRIPIRRVKNNYSKQYMCNLKLRKQVQYDIKRYMVEHFSIVYLEKIEGLWKYVDRIQKMKKAEKQRQKRMKGTRNVLKQNATPLPSLKNMDRHYVGTVQPVSLKGIENIQKLLLREKYQFSQFWDLQVDTAHNFKYYFNQSNPDLLGGDNQNQTLKNRGFF